MAPSTASSKFVGGTWLAAARHPVGVRYEMRAAWLYGRARSTRSTSPGDRLPRAAARLTATVVRPEPPFGEYTATVEAACWGATILARAIRLGRVSLRCSTSLVSSMIA